MKQNWEYCKIENIATIEYGTRVVQKRDGGSIYPVYGGGGATFRMDTFNREDRMVIARFAMSKQCTRIVKGKFFLNDSGLTVSTTSELLSQQYLDRCLLSMNDSIYSLGNGAAQKNLDMKAFVKIEIPVPPLTTQQSIVSELDTLSQIIADYKEQLADYDKLEQSIFYDMFGDPVKNEKGWEVKKLGEVSNVKTGPFGSLLHKQDYICNGVPLVNPIHMKDYKILFDNNFTISEQKAKDLKEYILKENDVILARRGDIGRCAIVTKNEEGVLCGTGSLFVRFNTVISPTFVMFVVRAESFSKDLISKAKGATMLNLNTTIVEILEFPLPPFSLQQEFASKIESIEQMKADTKEALKDAELLFQSRMDYWFNA